MPDLQVQAQSPYSGRQDPHTDLFQAPLLHKPGKKLLAGRSYQSG